MRNWRGEQRALVVYFKQYANFKFYCLNLVFSTVKIQRFKFNTLNCQVSLALILLSIFYLLSHFAELKSFGIWAGF